MTKPRSGSCRVRSVLRALCALFLLAGIGLALSPTPARGEVTAEQVLSAIQRGRDYLLRNQRADGSWMDYQISPGGVSSLATLSLINAGVDPESPAIQRALRHLRNPQTVKPKRTYSVALQTMVFAVASPVEDRQRLRENVDWLEKTQLKSGLWAYGEGRGGNGDNSNAQYAMLALRDAEEAGIKVKANTWRQAERHWRNSQAPGGGWAYGGLGRGASGSMTVAGIASTIIAQGKLHDGGEEIINGKPHNCGQYAKNNSLEKALDWMGRHFSIHRNPGPGGGNWLLYYLYGLERAGRLSGQRFFYGPRDQKHDWYREGAEHLVDAQDKLTGSWKGNGFAEKDEIIGTSFALLFLSKGLAPVAINKLMHGPGNDWNNDQNDVRNLTDAIAKQDGWPKLLTWQIVDIRAATVEDLLQAPICYFNGHQAPEFSDEQLAVLRDYVGQGGFLFVEACCSRPEFDTGWRRLAKTMYPEAEYRLKRLSPDHPVWRAFHILDPDNSTPLWGIDVGCRTAVIYAPEDLSCFWEQAGGRETKDPKVLPMIEKALSVGTNIVAYATGREIDSRLAVREVIRDEGQDERIRRGFLQIAKVRFAGGNWDAAPQALRNLHIALREAVHLDVVTRQKNVAILDPVLFQHPLIFMHGRSAFNLSDQEKAKLKQYLEFGGTLMADACCGSEAFDRSFRRLLGAMFPDQPVERIPASHAMFTTATGYDLSQVKRKEPQRAGPNEKLENIVRNVEPFLEGIEIDGRYAVIYSKYDISCALERQASVECRGYVHEDAVKIGINVVLYALAP